MAFTIDPLVLTSIIAVASALVGAVVGYLLSEWGARRRDARQTARRIGQTAVVLLVDINTALTVVDGIPDSPEKVTNPEKQFRRSDFTILSADALVRALLDFPDALRTRIDRVYSRRADLDNALDRVRERSDILLGPLPVDSVNRTWTPGMAADTEFIMLLGKLAIAKRTFLSAGRLAFAELSQLALHEVAGEKL